MKNVITVFFLILILSLQSTNYAQTKMPQPVKLDYEQFWKKIDPDQMVNTIFVSVLIDTSGNVLSAKIQKGNNNNTDSTALEFARHLKFIPAEQKGIKIPIQCVIPFPKPEPPKLKKGTKV